MRVRTLEQLRDDGDLAWFRPTIERLPSLVREADPSVPPFLAIDRPVMLARAPGRLDVMGGIADYSGSLVLEMPLDRATCAIAQAQDALRIDVVSVREGGPVAFGVDLADVFRGEGGWPGSRDRARAATMADSSRAREAGGALAEWFDERPADRWATYVVGGVVRCLTLFGVNEPPHGLRLAIASDVPEG